MTLKILLIYKKHRGALGGYYERLFNKYGFDVSVFDLSKAPKWMIRGDSRVVLPPIKNIKISELIDLYGAPDFIFEIDGGDRHLSGWHKVKMPKIFYAIDSHLVLKFHKKILNDFDLIFVAQKEFVPLFKEIVENVYWLPHAADPEIHKRLELPRIFDIGHVGQLNFRSHRDRVRIIKNISEIYSVLAVERIYDEDLSKIYSLSKIGFNKSIKNDLNMRIFEVMSCGTMLLTDKINRSGMEELFENRKHLVLYESEEELREIIEYYLEKRDEREKIAINGQKEVHDKHTYDLRMRAILGHLKLNYKIEQHL